MSPIFLLLPGVEGWELVETDRPDRPLISGALLPSDAPVVHQLPSRPRVGTHPTTQKREPRT